MEALRCEYRKCGTVRTGKPGQSLEDLRSLLREQGWLCVNEVDVCPSCRTQT